MPPQGWCAPPRRWIKGNFSQNNLSFWANWCIKARECDWLRRTSWSPLRVAEDIRRLRLSKEHVAIPLPKFLQFLKATACKRIDPRRSRKPLPPTLMHLCVCRPPSRPQKAWWELTVNTGRKGPRHIATSQHRACAFSCRNPTDDKGGVFIPMILSDPTTLTIAVFRSNQIMCSDRSPSAKNGIMFSARGRSASRTRSYFLVPPVR